jgi:hypothetical protein
MTRELDLDALLGDPVVRLMMASDGIEGGDVRQIVQRVRSARSLKKRLSVPLAPEAQRPSPRYAVETAV